MGTSRVDAADDGSRSDLRFLTYSHDGFGLGHFRRSLRLAGALAAAAPGSSILAATGAAVPHHFPLPFGVDYLKIPSVAKVANGRYLGRSLSLPPEDLFGVRSSVLTAAITALRPDLVLVDRYPLGLLGELRAGLERLRDQAPETKIVLGLRDVIDEPATVRDEWELGGYASALQEYYDLILVYGSRAVYDATEAYEFPASLAGRTLYTGYLCEPLKPEGAAKVRAKLRASGHRVALCTVGGGEDGYGLASTFIEGIRSMGDDWAAVVVTGPLMSREQVKELRAAADTGGRIRVHSYVEDLPAYIDAADVVVSMGGYNTLCEALSVGARMVVVPRTHPRREQAIRSHLFAERGVVQVVERAAPDAAGLVEAMLDLVEVPREQIRERIREGFDLAGLTQATTAMMQLIAGRNGEREARVIDLRSSVFSSSDPTPRKAST